MTDQEPLEVLVTCRTEFEAHAKAALLRSAGIDAFVFESPGDNQPLGPTERVAVQVRREDVADAQQVLEEAAAEAQDTEPDGRPARMPALARVAFAIALLVVAVTIVAAVAALIVS